MASVETAPNLRRAVVLMTGSSFLVPAAGLVTAPVLARALSASGRGELAAALAPAVLMLAAATLGLPDALTYFIAKRPGLTQPGLRLGSLVTVGLGLVCLGVVVLTSDVLAGSDRELSRLIVLATVLTVPALVINVTRGAAIGLQMWNRVAAERVISAALKVVGFVALALADQLTVLSAMLVYTITVLVSGLVYIPLAWYPKAGSTDVENLEGLVDHEGKVPEGLTKLILSFGGRVWLGSVASMLLSRSTQLLMTPLSDARQLGLYTVAATISDVVLLAALAIQGALFGVNSKARDAAQFAFVSRLTLLVAVLGSIPLVATLPFWIAPLFGADFAGALVPAFILQASALISIPGLMAASGLAAWGRPGLRTAGLSLTLAVFITAFFLLVPPYGAYGACLASLACNVAMSSFMVLAARRTMRLYLRDFLYITPSDFMRLVSELGRAIRKVGLKSGPTA